jgi:CRP-like cAMP-binding protein
VRTDVVVWLLRSRLKKPIGGDAAAAEAIAAVAELRQHPTDTRIIEEGASDNDIFFILAGSVRVEVAGR